MTDPAAVLRRRMRTARRALPVAERVRSARLASRRLAALGLLRSGDRFAIYLPVGGEMPTEPLRRIADARGCEVFVPRVTSTRSFRMTFVPLRPPYRRNRYGIPEPLRTDGALGARWMDVVIVPLTAFDATGTRLGSGAGYYDRALAHLALREEWRRPRVVGFAYDFQRVEALERRRWD
ncbi:MAG: 5-formyltetrahydrofolate cyclo-ligase, partial [Steroidobacteraceae bacterium]